MPPPLSRERINREFGSREDVLPQPINGSIRILTLQRVRQIDVPETQPHILLVLQPGSGKMVSERFGKWLRQDRASILLAFAIAHDDSGSSRNQGL
jgi:hypothetical protein